MFQVSDINAATKEMLTQPLLFSIGIRIPGILRVFVSIGIRIPDIVRVFVRVFVRLELNG